MSDATPRTRLDSWKAIAGYLGRDVRTVRRWEEHGLPVRRVGGGRGRSVFAYADEIDAWLARSQTPAQTPPFASRRGRWPTVAAGTALLLFAGVALWQLTATRGAADVLRVSVSDEGVIARDAADRERWRHVFPSTWKTIALQDRAVVFGGERPAVYAATAHQVRLSDNAGGSGELLEFDPEGTLRRTFSFADEVIVEGKPYGPPWALTGFAVDATQVARRIAVAAHHYIWSPSVVTILDEAWNRTGTFVHNGWIEHVYWLGPDLLISGFSNERNAGVVALLDSSSMTPRRMIAMPRSEVNEAAAARFNRAVVQPVGDRILVRTLEVSTSELAADIVYDFDRALVLKSATFSTQYWDAHRALEREGKLAHPRDQCPDRDGPREIAIWNQSDGWKLHQLR